MSLIRTICGMEWRVASPSAYVLLCTDMPENWMAVHYDNALRCWRISERNYAHPMRYATRNEAMSNINHAMNEVMGGYSA